MIQIAMNSISLTADDHTKKIYNHDDFVEANNDNNRGDAKIDHEDGQVSLEENNYGKQQQRQTDKLLIKPHQQLTVTTNTTSHVTPLNFDNNYNNNNNKETGSNHHHNNDNAKNIILFNNDGCSYSHSTTLKSSPSLLSNHDNQLSFSTTTDGCDDNNSNHNNNVTATNNKNFKDLIESPILNKGLSPRLNRMMIKSNCFANIEKDGDNGHDSIKLNLDENEPNESTMINGIDANPDADSVITAVATKLLNVNKSPNHLASQYCVGSMRAMTILKAAAAASSIQQLSSSPSSLTNENRQSIATESSNNVKDFLQPRRNFGKRLERSSSFQNMYPSSSTSPVSSYSRGSAFLKALQNQFTTTLAQYTLMTASPPPPSEIQNEESSSTSDISTDADQFFTPSKSSSSSLISILKSPGSTPSAKKKKVLFLDPVVSDRFYFDQSISTLKSDSVQSSFDNFLNESDKRKIKHKRTELDICYDANPKFDENIDQAESQTNPSHKTEATVFDLSTNKKVGSAKKVDEIFRVRSRKFSRRNFETLSDDTDHYKIDESKSSSSNDSNQPLDLTDANKNVSKESIVQSNKRRKLFHQETTLEEDCEDVDVINFVEKPQQTSLSDTNSDDSEDVYFSLSSCDESVQDDATNDISLSNVEQTLPNNEDISMAKLESPSESDECLEEKPSKGGDQMMLDDGDDNLDANDQAESLQTSEIIDENTKIRSGNINSEDKNEDEEMLTIQMPLNLAKKFYHYLGKYLQSYQNGGI